MVDLRGVAGAVRRWVEVPERWAGHRPEPLVAERLWTPGADAGGVGPRRRAGLDGDGHVVAVGPLDVPVEQWLATRAGVPEWVEIVDRSDHGHVVTVRGFWRRGAPCVTTTFDDAGRALVSRYGDGHPDERYLYDTAGRLIAIEESTGIASIDPPMWRDEDPIGGRLDVVYDDRGVRSVQREDSGLNIWERLDQPWPDARTGFAQQLTQASIAGMAEECRRARHDPSDEVFSLALVPYPTALSQLRPGLFAGREQDRQRLIANPDEDLEEYLWWGQHSTVDALVGVADLPIETQRAAVRATAMNDLGDALETVCQAAVPLLAAHDWSGIFTPTPDFAVYVIGEDVSAADIYQSMLAGNPPQRLAERAARWRGSPYPPEDE